MKDTAKVKVAVVGVGRMGGLHLKKYAHLPGVELVGVHDIDEARLVEVANQFGVKPYQDLSALLFDADAVVIATPTATHYPIGRMALEAGCHVLIEKPVAHTVESAEELVRLAEERKLILQVGLIERFRYSILSEGMDLSHIRFVEAERLSPSLSREASIDVVTDLMIHDLDLVLSLLGDDPSHVSAIGVPVLTDHYDLANVRLEFPGGAVVNLNVSRVSAKPLRKLRIFSRDAYASMDFLHNKVKIFSKLPTGEIHGHEQEYGELDALLAQSNHFISCIREGSSPLVTGKDGVRALRFAKIIRERIEDRSQWSLPPKGPVVERKDA